MKVLIQIFMSLFLLFLVSCASTRGVRPHGDDLQYSSAKRMPAWVTDMRRIRRTQRDRIYFQGIGENQRERIANDEAARDAALQFSRYIMTRITSEQEEQVKSENLISNIVAEKTEVQFTENVATQQYLVERYIEKRVADEFDRPVEYFRIYALYSFPKLQSVTVLKDVAETLKAHRTSDEEVRNSFRAAASTIENLIREIERDEAFIVNVNR